MGFERLLTEEERQQRNDVKTTKNTHNAQSWTLLNQADKNALLGEVLVDLGYVQA